MRKLFILFIITFFMSCNQSDLIDYENKKLGFRLKMPSQPVTKMVKSVLKEFGKVRNDLFISQNKKLNLVLSTFNKPNVDSSIFIEKIRGSLEAQTKEQSVVDNSNENSALIRAKKTIAKIYWNNQKVFVLYLSPIQENDKIIKEVLNSFEFTNGLSNGL